MSNRTQCFTMDSYHHRVSNFRTDCSFHSTNSSFLLSKSIFRVEHRVFQMLKMPFIFCLCYFTRCSISSFLIFLQEHSFSHGLFFLFINLDQGEMMRSSCKTSFQDLEVIYNNAWMTKPFHPYSRNLPSYDAVRETVSESF